MASSSHQKDLMLANNAEEPEELRLQVFHATVTDVPSRVEVRLANYELVISNH